ncbi:MAG TPA: hypothetical protein PKH94_00885 [Bacteroidales bacterium]|nr:hypothetical protein [Bacteroidales bacterium]HNS45771.1 hypothetical protein [Bacteroidales bacterium]
MKKKMYLGAEEGFLGRSALAVKETPVPDNKRKKDNASKGKDLRFMECGFEKLTLKIMDLFKKGMVPASGFHSLFCQFHLNP